jgi:hypothetical protein
MSNFTSFKSLGLIGDLQITEQLQDGIVSLLDWAFLGLGSFANVTTGTTYPFGGNPSTLRLSDDPRYTPGLVWDGFRNNWIWEQNIEYSVQPINISGIYINSQFYPLSTTGSFSYNISYPQGRVVFNSPIPTTSKVQVEFSYRMYNMYTASVQWFRDVMEGSLRLDDLQFNNRGSGNWSITPESRVMLPAIVVESIPNRKHLGKGLGGGFWMYQDILFHVFGATTPSRNNAIDILDYQSEKRFFLFDKNMVARSGAFPLNQYGFLVNQSNNYPYLINTYMYRPFIVRETTSQKMENEAQSIQVGNCTWNIEIDFGDL